MINNTDDYIALQTGRAAGTLPDMGCAMRVADLIKHMANNPFDKQGPIEVLDVGCATGHLLRTFMRQKVRFTKYVGLEIDPEMLVAAQKVWVDEIKRGTAEFINQDLELFSSNEKFDFVVCVNAFMYFASAKTALTNLINATRRHLIIRSYFTDSNYRIVRAQTKNNHDKSNIAEIDVFDEKGNILCYDFWNIYSHTYIESLVNKINPSAKVEWIEDKNILSSMVQERELNIAKRGATEVLEGHEVSYPFILPWKYLSITLD